MEPKEETGQMPAKSEVKEGHQASSSSASYVPVAPHPREVSAAQPSVIQQERSQVPWVEATARRMAAVDESGREEHGAGRRLWGAAAMLHNREESSERAGAPIAARDQVEPALLPILEELEVVRSGLAVTDPAYEISRCTLVVEGRPTQVLV